MIPAISMKTDVDGAPFPPTVERPVLFAGPMVRALLAGRKTVTRRLVKWKPIEPGLNLAFSGLEAGLYNTTNPRSGWVLRSRGAGGCWNDRTRRLHCPFGAPGERLWVRETFYCDDFQYKSAPDDLKQQREFLDALYYRADAERTGTVCELIPECLCDGSSPWKPGIHMPRWASRISLEVLDARVERLWAIDDDDSRREGVVSGRIPANEDGPERIGYVLGDDDGKCTLYPTEREAFAKGWDSINGVRAAWAANPWVWRVAFRRLDAEAGR